MATRSSPRSARTRKPKRARAAKDAAGAADTGLADGGRVRLQKILAAAGIASRRGAEELIRQGRVSVDGLESKIGDSADPFRDEIALDGERIRPEKPAYWIVNKPRGVLTTRSDPERRPIIMGLLPRDVGGVFPVGRLDRDTEGLVLLTNDGALAHTLLHPSRENEREYHVVVRGSLEEKKQKRLSRGVHLEEGMTSPARVGRVRYDADSDTTEFSLTLIEGRKRQIRRSLRALGHPVKHLVRVRMGPLRLGRLARGEARTLRSEELRALREHAARLERRAQSRPASARRRRGVQHRR